MNLTENQTRKVVVSGVPDVLPCSRMKDKLFIHFQSSKSHGGDVDAIQYPTNLDGVAVVIFDKMQDARKVVAKEQQILQDKDFPQDYLLTVYDFTPNVFFYATAEVDLSIFHHQGADCLSLLLQSLRSLHRSVRITGSASGAASVSVEGPFDAVRALREDLMSRASALEKGAPLSGEEVTTDAPYEQMRDLPGGEALWELKSRGGAWVDMGGGSKLADLGRRADVMEEYSDSEPAISTEAAVAAHAPARLHDDASDPSPPYERETPRQLPHQPQEERSGWVDTNTMLYVQRCRGDALDTCLRAHGVTARYENGSDLTEVILNAIDPRAVQTALTDLMFLVDYWQSELRIHTIDCEKCAPDEWRRVREICKNVNGRFPEVLCLEMGSSIKIIGSSTFSHLFHESVKDQINML